MNTSKTTKISYIKDGQKSNLKEGLPTPYITWRDLNGKVPKKPTFPCQGKLHEYANMSREFVQKSLLTLEERLKGENLPLDALYKELNKVFGFRLFFNQIVKKGNFSVFNIHGLFALFKKVQAKKKWDFVGLLKEDDFLPGESQTVGAYFGDALPDSSFNLGQQQFFLNEYHILEERFYRYPKKFFLSFTTKWDGYQADRFMRARDNLFKNESKQGTFIFDANMKNLKNSLNALGKDTEMHDRLKRNINEDLSIAVNPKKSVSVNLGDFEPYVYQTEDDEGHKEEFSFVVWLDPNHTCALSLRKHGNEVHAYTILTDAMVKKDVGVFQKGVIKYYERELKT